MKTRRAHGDGLDFATTSGARYSVFVSSKYQPKPHAIRLGDAATTTDDHDRAKRAAELASQVMMSGRRNQVWLVDFEAGTARRVKAAS